eukprot:PhM_4_TR4166/c0_g1_i5/m.25821
MQHNPTQGGSSFSALYHGDGNGDDINSYDRVARIQSRIMDVRQRLAQPLARSGSRSNSNNVEVPVINIVEDIASSNVSLQVSPVRPVRPRHISPTMPNDSEIDNNDDRNDRAPAHLTAAVGASSAYVSPAMTPTASALQKQMATLRTEIMNQHTRTEAGRRQLEAERFETALRGTDSAAFQIPHTSGDVNPQPRPDPLADKDTVNGSPSLLANLTDQLFRHRQGGHRNNSNNNNNNNNNNASATEKSTASPFRVRHDDSSYLVGLSPPQPPPQRAPSAQQHRHQDREQQQQPAEGWQDVHHHVDPTPAVHRDDAARRAAPKQQHLRAPSTTPVAAQPPTGHVHPVVVSTEELLYLLRARGTISVFRDEFGRPVADDVSAPDIPQHQFSIDSEELSVVLSMRQKKQHQKDRAAHSNQSPATTKSSSQCESQSLQRRNIHSTPSKAVDRRPYTSTATTPKNRTSTPNNGGNKAVARSTSRVTATPRWK